MVVSEERNQRNRAGTRDYNERQCCWKKLKLHIKRAHCVPENIDPEWPIPTHSLVKLLGVRGK